MSIPPRLRALRPALLAILLAAAVLPVLVVRAHHSFGPITYRLMGYTRALVEGAGLGAVRPPQPPGYSLLLVPPFALGIDPMFAGAALSWLAFVLSVVVVWRLLDWSVGSRLVFPALVLFLMQERLLSYGTQAWVEGVHAFSILLAVLVFAILERRNYRLPEGLFPRLSSAVAAGLAIVAPFSLGLSGLVATISVGTALVIGASRRRDRAAVRDCLSIAGVALALAALLMARNWSLTGTLTGLAAGGPPTYDFLGGLAAMVRQIGMDGLGIPLRLAGSMAGRSATLWLALSALILAWLCLHVDRRPLARLVAVNVGLSVVFVAALGSTGPIDTISSREVYPLIPLLTLLLLLLAARAFDPAHRNIATRVSAGLAASLLALSLFSVAYKLVKGAGVTHAERAFGYAPRTTRALLALVSAAPPGDRLRVAANQYGEQVLAYTGRIDLSIIPGADLMNEDYARAHGIQRLSESESRDLFRRHRTEWFAFFHGPSGIDECLARHCYGDLVSRIHAGLPGVELSRTQLADGVLIRVDADKW